MNVGALKLIPVVQHYAWGARTPDSAVYRFALRNGVAGPDNSDWPYSELWFGAHPRASSKTADGEPLSTIIQADPERVLGEVYSLNNRKLPFLFKVLSVRIPLSIQLHPNKQQAAELHIRDGINYPDSNHKPELAYALSEVSLLYGFRTYPEIHENVTSIAELSELIPDSIVIEAARLAKARKEPQAIRSLFETLLRSDSTRAKEAAIRLAKRIKRESQTNRSEIHCQQLAEWILSTAEAHPADPGIFAFYFLNLRTVQPGSAVFIDAGVPHAYLTGELLECMASSDNTIRAGLTPKVCDVETLIKCADFTAQSGSLFAAEQVADGVVRFAPPVQEFQLFRYFAEADGFLEVEDHTSVPEFWFVLSGSVDLSLNGSSLVLQEGEGGIVPAFTRSAVDDSLQSFQFRATVKPNAENGIVFRLLPNVISG